MRGLSFSITPAAGFYVLVSVRGKEVVRYDGLPLLHAKTSFRIGPPYHSHELGDPSIEMSQTWGPDNIITIQSKFFIELPDGFVKIFIPWVSAACNFQEIESIFEVVICAWEAGGHWHDLMRLEHVLITCCRMINV